MITSQHSETMFEQTDKHGSLKTNGTLYSSFVSLKHIPNLTADLLYFSQSFSSFHFQTLTYIRCLDFVPEQNIDILKKKYQTQV